jgi:hypothetical protein
MLGPKVSDPDRSSSLPVSRHQQNFPQIHSNRQSLQRISWSWTISCHARSTSIVARYGSEQNSLCRNSQFGRELVHCGIAFHFFLQIAFASLQMVQLTIIGKTPLQCLAKSTTSLTWKIESPVRGQSANRPWCGPKFPRGRYNHECACPNVGTCTVPRGNAQYL